MASIPWYPDELSAEERGAVDAHAAHCADCRRELEARLADPSDQAEWPTPDPDGVFTRVLARIELDEAEGLREWARAPRRTRAVRWLREREVHVPGLAAPVSVSRGLSAAASFGALIAAVALVTTLSTGRGPVRPTESDLPRIDVVFRDEITTRSMAEALAAIDGEIVAGPSARGRYRVALPEDTDPETAAQTLSDAGVVIYAEPAEDPPTP
jgi:hypothetical protein